MGNAVGTIFIKVVDDANKTITSLSYIQPNLLLYTDEVSFDMPNRTYRLTFTTGHDTTTDQTVTGVGHGRRDRWGSRAIATYTVAIYRNVCSNLHHDVYTTLYDVNYPHDGLKDKKYLNSTSCNSLIDVST